MTSNREARATGHLPDDATPGGLAALRVPARPQLAPRILAEVGLADRIAPLETTIGTLWVAWNGLGVTAADLVPEGADPAAVHAARSGRSTTREPALPSNLGTAIARRLAGDRRARVPLDLRGATAFEMAVWEKALEIPRGEVRPYGWVAAEIGRPRAVRAVGTALGHNPVPLIVPCHRVVRSDGMLGQYSLGGPGNKRAILAWEGLDPDALEVAARRGERLLGAATTRIVCWPTCRNARRIAPANRVRFGSLRAAEAAGFRACRVCRPSPAVA